MTRIYVERGNWRRVMNWNDYALRGNLYWPLNALQKNYGRMSIDTGFLISKKCRKSHRKTIKTFLIFPMKSILHFF
jgi:hypothetical protein